MLSSCDSHRRRRRINEVPVDLTNRRCIDRRALFSYILYIANKKSVAGFNPKLSSFMKLYDPDRFSDLVPNSIRFSQIKISGNSTKKNLRRATLTPGKRIN